MPYINDQWVGEEEYLATKLGGEHRITLPLEEYDYSFFEYGIWEKDGQLYVATDSGCSCPTPFESTTVDDLTGPLTPEQAAEEYTSIAREQTGYNRLSDDEIARNAARIRGL